MKKIAIVTFSQQINWGAILQAYALQEYLSLEGYFVNHLKILNREDRCGSFGAYIRLLLRKLRQLAHVMRARRFADFSKRYLKFSPYIISSDGADDRIVSGAFDVFICGSDQVWNCKHTIDKPYFLSFVTGKPKISYAASFGVETIPEKYSAPVKHLLSDYCAISVRESAGARILRELGVRCDCVVMDPVFLLGRASWEKMIPVDRKSARNDYIFVYIPKVDEAIINVIQYMKEATKLEVKSTYSIPGCTYCGNIGPLEFLGLINNAKYVYVSSFHATAFSILFHKPFFASVSNEKSNRVTHLLSMLQLESQIVHDAVMPKLDTPIDYDRVDSLLSAQIKASKEFLLKNIENSIGMPYEKGEEVKNAD